jgi:peptidoglycan/LPS O-acetylase OafA/YrhL
MIFHFGTLSELKRFSYYFYFLFAGGIMALLEEQQKLTFLKSWNFFSILIVALTFMYFFTDILKTQIFWLDQLIALVLFSCFVHTISFNNFGITIKNKILIYFGKISYGIYMYHVIALNFVVFLFLHFEFLRNLPPELIILLIFSLTFGFSIAISHLSYRYYESYFLRLKQKFR